MTQRDTIQGLISAIESITQGYSQGTNRRRQLEQLDLQKKRQDQYDKYAANDEQRSAERHELAMDRGQPKPPVERLLKTNQALSTSDAARALSAREFALANGDADKMVNSLSAKLEALKASAPVKREADPNDVFGQDDEGYKDELKAYERDVADLEQAIAAGMAFRLDNQGAPQPGPMAAPGQQPSPMPAAAPGVDPAFLNAVEKLTNQARALEEARQRRASGQQPNPVDGQMAARAVNNVVPVKVSPLVGPGQFTQQQIDNSFMSGNHSKGTTDWFKGLPGGDKRRAK